MGSTDANLKLQDEESTTDSLRYLVLGVSRQGRRMTALRIHGLMVQGLVGSARRTLQPAALVPSHLCSRIVFCRLPILLPLNCADRLRWPLAGLQSHRWWGDR